MKEKLKKYFERMPSVITCAAALNPCFNIHGVEWLIETISTDLEFFDDGHATKAKKWFNDSLEATSVASESAFSTCGRVLSIRRTKLTPSSLEICMCLKDHLDAQEHKQHTSTFENTLDFEDEILDADVQENEATPLSDEEIALDAASQCTMEFGSGGEEQDFDYDLLNYGIDD
ncbi:zinc finger BED domain-containing protein RICESLEEPER 2-like protein [Tanacetum coccineum]